MQNQDFQLISQEFMRRLSRHRIQSFFDEVENNSELLTELGKTNLTPEVVAAVAKSRNFVFSAEQLTEYIEECISTQLTSEEVLQRESYLKNFSPLPISFEEAETYGVVHEESLCENFKLDRVSLLSGDVVVIRSSAALLSLIELMRRTLQSALGIEDLANAHKLVSHSIMKEKAVEANIAFSNNSKVPEIIQKIVLELGMNPADILWEWPGFRMFFPEGYESQGSYRNGTTGLLSAHRDTWYGSPQHQINLWGPIEPISEDKTLRILSEFHQKRVMNSSGGIDCWAHNLGLALPPSLLEVIAPKNYLAPSLNVGDVMLFSGHSLHASAPSEKSSTRVTFEFRFLNKNDREAFYTPSNIDYFGKGEIYRSWFNTDGVQINLYSGKPFQKT